jgi:hypothetical protein
LFKETPLALLVGQKPFGLINEKTDEVLAKKTRSSRRPYQEDGQPISMRSP